MHLARRRFLALASAAVATGTMPRDVWSQSYPASPVRVIVPYPPGGTTDLIARNVSFALGNLWGQTIVVENKAGAGTLIGTETVARAPPDGYTLLATAEATFVVNPYVYAKLPYRAEDFIPISGLGISTHVLVTNAATPIKNFEDFVTLAKAKPGGLDYGTFGIGSSSHLNMELLQSAAGIKLTPVHYKGASPMLNDLIAGHIPLAFTGITLAAEPLKAGRIRGLGIGALQRLSQFPDLPTIAESGLPGFQAISWFGLFAPSKTAPDIVNKINAGTQRVLGNADFQQKFLEPSYLHPMSGSPERFAEYVRLESAKWGRIIKDAKISVD